MDDYIPNIKLCQETKENENFVRSNQTRKMGRAQAKKHSR